MVLPSLILQKPSATSKAKDHSAAIDHRLTLFTSLKEVKFIQKKVVTLKKAGSVEDISKIFAKLIMQGKLSVALTFLGREILSGFHTLTSEVLEELASEIDDECLLQGTVNFVPPHIFDVINEQEILFWNLFEY